MFSTQYPTICTSVFLCRMLLRRPVSPAVSGLTGSDTTDDNQDIGMEYDDLGRPIGVADKTAIATSEYDLAAAGQPHTQADQGRLSHGDVLHVHVGQSDEERDGSAGLLCGRVSLRANGDRSGYAAGAATGDDGETSRWRAARPRRKRPEATTTEPHRRRGSGSIRALVPHGGPLERRTARGTSSPEDGSPGTIEGHSGAPLRAARTSPERLPWKDKTPEFRPLTSKKS